MPCEIGFNIPSWAAGTIPVTEAINTIHQIGADGIRFDLAINECLAPGPAATPNYSGLDEVCAHGGAAGLKLIVVLELIIPTGVSSWDTLVGGAYVAATSAFWPVWKRPPSGQPVNEEGGGPVWDAMVSRINLVLARLKTQWVAAGRDPADVLIQVRNEPGFGGAGCGHLAGEAIIQTAATAANLEGKWDTSANWVGLSWVGRNGGVVVPGTQEIANYILPRLNFQGFKLCEASFECSTAAQSVNGTYAPVSTDPWKREMDTCRASGTYWSDSNFTNNATHYGFNCGAGVMPNRIMSPEEYAELSCRNIMDRAYRIQAANSQFSALRPICTEHAIPWINILGIRAQNHDWRGLFLAEFFRRVRGLPLEAVYFYTLRNESDALDQYYGLVDATIGGSWSPAIVRVAKAVSGAVLTASGTPPGAADGTTWQSEIAGQAPVSGIS